VSVVSCLGRDTMCLVCFSNHSFGSDDAFDDKCKSHVKKQIMLKYADMVVRDRQLICLC
jgi:hypothetical protein